MCVCARARVRVCVCVYACVRVGVGVYVWVCMCVNVCESIYIYISNRYMRAARLLLGLPPTRTHPREACVGTCLLFTQAYL